MVVIPVSSSVTGGALRPRISPAEGVDSDSGAVCRAVRAVPRTRFVQRLGTLEPDTMHHIDRALSLILGLVHAAERGPVGSGVK